LGKTYNLGKKGGFEGKKVFEGGVVEIILIK